MEYFSFINIILVFLFILIVLYFILIFSSLLYYQTINYNNYTVEFFSTFFSLIILIIIISPALIILMDSDLIIIPSYIIYSLGYQWAWQFNIIFQPCDIGFNVYCDQYIIAQSAKPKYPFIKYDIHTIANYHSYLLDPFNFNRFGYQWTWPILLKRLKFSTNYLFDINQYILLPLYSYVRLFVLSFDVIHTLGIYSWGIKIDAIPGRINLCHTLRLLCKGEHRGKCFELCGQGHLSMVIAALSIRYLYFLMFSKGFFLISCVLIYYFYVI